MLLHIYRIDYCPARLLDAAVVMAGTHTVVVYDVLPWRSVPLNGLASIETSEEVEKGVRKCSAKLSATLCGLRLALPDEPLAYRLHTVSGTVYLLGTALPPYPLTTQVESLPSSAAETSAVSLSVSLTGKEHGLLRML